MALNFRKPSDGPESNDGEIIVSGDGPATETIASVSAADDGSIIIDPASIGSGGDTASVAGDSPARKRRGRKPGSRNRTTKSPGTAIDLNGLEAVLVSAHGMLAGITKVSELEMDPEEAAKLAQAAANVSRHYDMTMSAKALDWTNLLMTIGAVYGSRIAAIRLRRIMEKAEASQRGGPEPVSRPSQPKGPSKGTMTTFIPGVGNVEVPVN